MTSTGGTLPLVYVRFGWNDVIQPPLGGRSEVGVIEIVFCPGWMRTGPYLNSSFRAPPEPGSVVVVIVPCGVRTDVERGLAWAAEASTRRATSAVIRAWNRRIARMSLLGAARQERNRDARARIAARRRDLPARLHRVAHVADEGAGAGGERVEVAREREPPERGRGDRGGLGHLEGTARCRRRGRGPRAARSRAPTTPRPGRRR